MWTSGCAGKFFLCVPWYLQLVAEALRFNDAAAADATARPAGDRCDFDASKYTDVAAAAEEDVLVAAGRRLNGTQQLFSQPKRRVRLAILAVVMEPHPEVARVLYQLGKDCAHDGAFP